MRYSAPGCTQCAAVSKALKAEAARLGGAILREKWGQTRTIAYKGGIDLVTDADRASEDAILAFLRARFPGAAVLAEESGASGAGSDGLRFYVDPLDGTTNYAHNYPFFCVSIGLEKDGKLAAGAVFDPIRGESFTGAAGEGIEHGMHTCRSDLVNGPEIVRSTIGSGSIKSAIQPGSEA